MLLAREFRALLEISIIPRRFVRIEIRIFFLRRKVLKTTWDQTGTKVPSQADAASVESFNECLISRVTLLQNPKISFR